MTAAFSVGFVERDKSTAAVPPHAPEGSRAFLKPTHALVNNAIVNMISIIIFFVCLEWCACVNSRQDITIGIIINYLLLLVILLIFIIYYYYKKH